MHCWILRLAFVVVVVSLPNSAAAQDVAQPVPEPAAVFGFTPGDDGKLIDYTQLVDYLEQAAAGSPRVEVREFGASTLGRPMVVVLISSPDNLGRLDELRAVNRRLALDPNIEAATRAELIDRGRVFLVATLSMHSTEVAPAQTLPLLVHQLATGDDDTTRRWLDEVVIMVVACLNPDGMDMIVEHFRSSVGTPYEGASMPGLYHHFIGHDNNRDFVVLNQAESRAFNRLYAAEWFPQVHVDKHQMGRTGPRYFVPEYHDPIAENIDARLWNWSDVFGSAMATEMASQGLAGVASHWTFDEYWPGATTTSHWKNLVSLLTEAASCRLATPVFVEPNELRVRGKGLAEYKKSVNMPAPWPGGWWRLGDIVRYELASWRGLLDTASLKRAEILRLRNDLCRSEVEAGRSRPPFYFVLPLRQHDASELDHLLRLLDEHGVELHRLTAPVTVGGRVFDAGDVVVTLAQPYRAFIKEVMERQYYPVRRYVPDGEIIRPYDITSWSLPLHFGVVSVELNARSTELEERIEPFQPPESVTPAVPGARGLALDPRDNSAYEAAFRALAAGAEVLRATVPMTMGETRLEPGAFVIRDPDADVLEAAAGGRSFAIPSALDDGLTALDPPRIGLIETWFHDMDGGWTRYLFERFGIEYSLLRPGDVAATDLAADFDVVVFPDADPDVLETGAYEERSEYRVADYRPEYRTGLGDEGRAAIERFLEAGGRVVAWGRSTRLLVEPVTLGEGDDAVQVEVPVDDQAEALADRGLYVPGSLLAVELIEDHPLTWGMPADTPAFSRGRPVLATEPPMLVADRRVIGRFPERDIVVSGYAERPELLAERPAMVWARLGRGQLVLFGFQPQFRASTPTTYKLLFNALLLPELPPAAAGVVGAAP